MPDVSSSTYPFRLLHGVAGFVTDDVSDVRMVVGIGQEVRRNKTVYEVRGSGYDAQGAGEVDLHGSLSIKICWYSANRRTWLVFLVVEWLGLTSEWFHDLCFAAVDSIGGPAVRMSQQGACMFQAGGIASDLGSQVVFGEQLGDLGFFHNSCHEALPHGLPARGPTDSLVDVAGAFSVAEQVL
jgi:hypothetical protein